MHARSLARTVLRSVCFNREKWFVASQDAQRESCIRRGYGDTSWRRNNLVVNREHGFTQKYLYIICDMKINATRSHHNGANTRHTLSQWDGH